MIKILISGDFCPIYRVEQLALNGSYDKIYNDFINVLEDNDFNITNLECPLYNGSGAIPKTGPNLKVNESLVKSLVYGKFHLVTLANNHLMDFGYNGLKSTLEVCKRENIATVGAGYNLAEAHIPFYKMIKGKRIAILNFAENEFSTTQDERPGANPLNPITNFYDIKEARSKADFVFVIVHGGHEHYQLPSPRMQETYRFFINAGADAVIGHHTHCFSGYEMYQGKPIFYSLGNFIFDWFKRNNSVWNEGYAVEFNIKNSDLTFKLHPYIQGDQQAGVRLMKEHEMKTFHDQLAILNSIIGDPIKLKMKFTEFCLSRKQNYLSYLEPYSNSYLSSLYLKGLLPSFVTAQKKKLFLNITRCEAHRDILLKILTIK